MPRFRLVLRAARARTQHGAAFNHKPGSKGASYFMYFPGTLYCLLRADQSCFDLISYTTYPGTEVRYTSGSKLKLANTTRLHVKAKTSKFLGGGGMMGGCHTLT